MITSCPISTQLVGGGIAFHDLVATSEVGVSEYVLVGAMSIILSELPTMSNTSSQSRFTAQIVAISFGLELWVFW